MLLCIFKLNDRVAFCHNFVLSLALIPATRMSNGNSSSLSIVRPVSLSGIYPFTRI